MRRRSIFLFGLGIGAWLNIWPPALHPWAGFVFAYALVFVALVTHALSLCSTHRLATPEAEIARLQEMAA